jgi:hypothetical protein
MPEASLRLRQTAGHQLSIVLQILCAIGSMHLKNSALLPGIARISPAR